MAGRTTKELETSWNCRKCVCVFGGNMRASKGLAQNVFIMPAHTYSHNLKKELGQAVRMTALMAVGERAL